MYCQICLPFWKWAQLEPTDKAYDIIVADMFKYVCILQIAVALEILSEFFIS